MPEPSGLPLTFALAMNICDTIWVDPTTKKKSSLGIFSTIGARAFPCQVERMAVYVALTDGHGIIPVRLQLIDAEEEREPLFEAEADLPAKEPRDVRELTVKLPPVSFPAPGEYRFQLFARGQSLIERRIVVKALIGPLDPREGQYP